MFLTSLLQLRGWASTRQAVAVSALFIFGNSFCGVEWRGCCFRVRQGRRVAHGLDAPSAPCAFAHQVGHRDSACDWLCRFGCATAV